MFLKLLYRSVLLAITVSYHAFAEDMTVDDFSENPEQRWQYVSDQVMGGVSSGTVEYKGQDKDAYASLIGEVSTDNNGGFIQIRTKLNKKQVADAKGVYIRARGNNQRYFIHLRTTGTMLPWQCYQSSFDVTEEWQNFELPLAGFSRSGNWLRGEIKPPSIRSIGIVAFGRDHQADLDIAEIGFF